MPWSEVTEMHAKLKFINDYLCNKYTIAHLCRVHNISRKTGYKIINRFNNFGIGGLSSLSRTHQNHPLTTDNETINFILDIKKEYPTWGPNKVKQFLDRDYSNKKWPAVSTIGGIFKKHGLVSSDRKRKRIVKPYTDPLKECDRPNAVWSADFKGQFKLGNKRYCYPLTITDNFSRYLIICKSLLSPNLKETKDGFIKAFQKYGLPQAIRTDNGSPFASNAIHGLSSLSIWFIKLGINIERIDLGHPEQNGRHERMHRTLKAEATKPPGSNLITQQKKFNKFINIYNNIRPHAALEGKSPSEIYMPSQINYPKKIKEVDYGADKTVRKVRYNGEIKFANREYYVGKVLKGETVGLKQFEEDVWIIYFYHLNIGMINTRKLLIERF